MNPAAAKLESLLRRACLAVLVPNGAAERLAVLVTGAGEWHFWFKGGERLRMAEEKGRLLATVSAFGEAVSTETDLEVNWNGTILACGLVARPVIFPVGEWLSTARIRLAVEGSRWVAATPQAFRKRRSLQKGGQILC